MEYIICCAIGYLLGNLSPSYLLGRKKGYDVREDGSGNAGAANTFILLGAGAFFLTAVVDILKAFAACRICELLYPQLAAAAALGGAACIIGHIYPVLLRFRGGKGLASLGGVILAWNWKWFLFLLATAIVIAFSTRYVSLVAPTMSVVFPLCYYWRTELIVPAFILLLPAAAIFAKHWENFVRIREGTEMRTNFIWNKEKELKRIGQWNPATEEQLKRRGK
ncbi:MAG: glycerol-3-phosphate acyltransferase [Oscillospiraceae bacterium]|nr:glycerol-3-phosphate acyltransferase [Oscillospiraceae bacterium]